MPANDPYGLIASGLPADMAAEARSLSRNQAIQEALLKQAMEPLGGARRAGRFMVAPSPWEGVSKLAQTYLATRGMEKGDERVASLGKRYQDRVTDELLNFQKQAQGTPGREKEVMPPDVAGPPQPAQPGVKADPRGAVMGAMMNPYLRNNPMLPALSKMVTPDWEVVEQYDANGNKKKVLMDKNNPQSQQPFGEAQKTTPMFKTVGVSVKGKESIPHDQEYISLDAGRTWNPAPGSVPTPKFKPGPDTVVDPNAKYAPISVVKRDKDGKDDPKLGTELISREQAIKEKRTLASNDPGVQSAIAGGRETATGEAKAKQASKDDQRSAMLALRNAGYDPTTGKDKISELIEASTSGMLERAGAAVPGFLGHSTEGMKALRTVESTANSIVLDLMNRKLGAGISNADRDFIVSQLGDVGNAMKPSGERLSAWRAAKNRMIDVGLHPMPGGGTGAATAIPDAAAIDAELARRARDRGGQ